jgi:hypothetical protein
MKITLTEARKLQREAYSDGKSQEYYRKKMHQLIVQSPQDILIKMVRLRTLLRMAEDRDNGLDYGNVVLYRMRPKHIMQEEWNNASKPKAR